MKQDKNHWENIYRTKQPDEVSWTQEFPQTTLNFIHDFKLPKTARIIDVGGGDSRLVDFLIDQGYNDITVLDISAKALEKARTRLGNRADKVKWIAQDIREFKSDNLFDLWHDRATFHFLTSKEEISKYLSTAKDCVKVNGYVIIGTFSVQGPETCSGLPVQRYNEHLLTEGFSDGFEKMSCSTEDHITPFNTKQNFIFCSFRRSEATPHIIKENTLH